jgi:glycosyltransferase involved in cell wall biosynthesis
VPPLPRSLDRANVAFVHDWLPVYGGAERVLEQMLRALPQGDVFSLFDFLPDDQRAFLGGRDVRTSFFQGLPLARSRYRYYLPLAPLAVEQFDLRGYDVVVSSSYLVAKGVLTTADQCHVAYVHSPVRYAWDLQSAYLEQHGMQRGLRGMLVRLVLHYLRLYDVASTNRVDALAANSHHVARRIWKTYRRRSTVIYPPVDTDAFTPVAAKEGYYVTVSRLVPYKRVDLIVEAFAGMPDRELIVIGDGPDLDRVRKLAGPNVTVLGYQPFDVVRHYMQRARAFVFAAEEDFGIVPVEAQACGTPVIAYGRGGALETVVDGETGVFFAKQTPQSLAEAVERFDRLQPRLSAEQVRLHAERFSKERFAREFASFVERAQRSLGPARFPTTYQAFESLE